jgi:hypothetical protein
VCRPALHYICCVQVTHVRAPCALFSDDTVDKRIALDAIKPIANAKLHKELLKFEEGCVRPIPVTPSCSFAFRVSAAHGVDLAQSLPSHSTACI